MKIQRLIILNRGKTTLSVQGSFRGRKFVTLAKKSDPLSILQDAISCTKRYLVLFRKYGDLILDSDGIDASKIPNKFNFKKEVKKIKWLITYDEVVGIK